jgi:hypothetical protein
MCLPEFTGLGICVGDRLEETVAYHKSVGSQRAKAQAGTKQVAGDAVHV